MKMKRKRLIFGLCCVACMASSTTVLAAERMNWTPSAMEGIMIPYMTYIYDSGASLTISSNGVAKIGAYVNGKSDTTGVEIEAQLQKKVNGTWTTIKIFTKESASISTKLSETYSVQKGYSYRVRVIVTARKGSFIESQTIISEERAY